MLARWTEAWETGDVDAIVVDARYSMLPQPEGYRGVGEIRAFGLPGPLTSRRRVLATTANGQPAFGTDV